MAPIVNDVLKGSEVLLRLLNRRDVEPAEDLRYQRVMRVLPLLLSEIRDVLGGEKESIRGLTGNRPRLFVLP